MGINNLKNLIWILLLVLPAVSWSQNTDCRTALVICSDQRFSFVPKNGRGIDDFNNPNNSEGCLERRENISAWFYFEFRRDMPPNSLISFTIVDTIGGCSQDYDFAIYGPQRYCDDLGEPIRCSFAQIDPRARVVRTGLDSLARDTSENLTGDGFVKALTVQPGQGFFLLIDFFVGACATFDSTRAETFNFSWGGSAAPFLNCIANPNCDLVQLTVAPDSTLCAGGAVPLRVTATNTNKQESYFWSGGATGTPFLLSTQGKQVTAAFPDTLPSGAYRYRVSVEEGNCIHTDSVEVAVVGLPQPTIRGDTVLCPGGTSLLTGPPGFQTYRWPDGSTDTTFLAQGGGNYSVTVTNAQGCAGSGTISLREKSVPNPIIVGDTLLCPGESTLLAAAPGYTNYRWSTGSTDSLLTVESGGTYTVTLTDADNCELVGAITLVDLPAPVPTLVGADYLCAGTRTVLRSGESWSGFQWTGGSTADSLVVTAPGTYQLTVTDGEGCTGEVQVFIREQANPVPIISGADPFCQGTTQTLRASPGFTRYLWNDNLIDSVRTISLPGIYQVTVTDSLGCQGSAQAQVDTLAAPRPQIMGDTILCIGETTTLSLSPFANYRWSTGDTTATILVDRTGLFTVTVTNPNGCTGAARAQVTIFPKPVADIQGDFILCPGETTTLSLRQPEPGLNFLWSTGAISPTIQVTTPGAITVAITDVRGCTNADTVMITAVSAPVVGIVGDTIICEGDEVVWQANPSNFFLFDWSNGDKSPQTVVSQAGTYSLTITDNNGCRDTAALTLRVNPNPVPAIAGIPKFCRGSSTNLFVGTEYQSVRWSTGATSTQISVNRPGLVSVVSTTTEGCVNTDTVLIQEFIPIRPQLPAQARLCEGDTLLLDPGHGFAAYEWSTGVFRRVLAVVDSGVYELTVVDTNTCISMASTEVFVVGVTRPRISGPGEFCEGQSVTLFATGGFSNYQWSTGTSGPLVNIRDGGTYTLSVTDPNGCIVKERITVTEKPAPAFEITGDTTICRGETTVLSVPTGFSRYLWNTDSTGNSIVVSGPGSYGVFITGTNGCSASDEITVVQSRIPFPIIDGDRFLCSKDTLNLEVLAGFLGYAWTNGDTTNVTKITVPGIYGITVTDDLGCTGRAQVRVVGKESPSVAIIAPTSICPGGNDSLRVNTQFKAYQWSNNSTNPVLPISAPGVYAVTVTADNDCTARALVDIPQGEVPEINFQGAPFFCSGGSTVIGLSTPMNTYSWSDGSERSTLVVNQPGIYAVSVTNRLGCRNNDSLFVQEIPLPLADAGPDTTLLCNRTLVRLGGSGTNTSTGFQATWTGPGIVDSNRQVFFPLVGRSGGYTLRVTDLTYGCLSLIDTVILTDLRSSPLAQIVPPEVLTCQQDSIVLDATMGTSQGNTFRYRWINSSGMAFAADTLRASVRTPGVYQLEINNLRNNCSSVTSVMVQQDTLRPVVTLNSPLALNCLRDSVIITAGAPPFGDTWRYSWIRDTNSSPLAEGNSRFFAAFQPGLYTVLARDLGNGCVGTASMVVTLDTLAPQVSAGNDLELDCFVVEAELRATPTQGNIQFTWSSLTTGAYQGSGASFRTRRADTYLVTAQNPTNGCIGQDTVRVTQYNGQPDSLEVQQFSERCFGEKNGRLQVTSVFGGEGPFLYRLNRQAFQTAGNFGGLAPGEYVLTVQDARGCEVSQTLLVNPGPSVEVDLGPDQTIAWGDIVKVEAVTSIPPGALGTITWTPQDTAACDTCLVWQFTPLKTVEVTAVARDTNGCVGADRLLIIVERQQRVYIPNAFSPNGDGANDQFIIFSGPDVVRVKSLQIYNRWGAMVFSKNDFIPNDPANGWDGRLNGKFLNPDVFVYKAEIEYFTGETELFKGDVALIR
ncbi:MAG: gliding motility-associated C-terminal domain-containing protein [Lewinellaceae bacterium]|nr:gliding motility-associated C-terminal domain-containing protein [Lewinellaceae bacterium]